MADEIEQWARDRAFKLSSEKGHSDIPCSAIDAFAAYIMEHEEPPVDPLLKEAREICADKAKFHGNRARAFAFVEGHNDETEQVQLALAALRRGIELGKAGEA